MAMNDYMPAIAAAAQQANIDPRLLASVIQTESSGNPSAFNASTGATGLGQQIPATAQALGINPTDPNQSITGTAEQLAQNLQRYGNVDQAVTAYHGGTNPANWGPKTQDYVQKVASAFQAMPSGQGSTPQAASADPVDQMLAQQAAKGAPTVSAPTTMPQTATANPSSAIASDPVDAMLAAQAKGTPIVPRGTMALNSHDPAVQEAALEDFMSPSDRASAQKLVQLVTAPNAASLENKGAFGRYGAGLGQTYYDTVQALSKGAGLVGNTLGLVSDSDLDTFMRASQMEQNNYENARQQATPQSPSGLITGQKPSPGIDWGRLTGQVATAGLLNGAAEEGAQLGVQWLEKLGFRAAQTVPTRLASAATTGASNALTGAGAAALASGQSNAPLGTQSAIGGAIGLIAAPVVSKMAGVLARPLVSLFDRIAPEASAAAPDVAAQQASNTMQQAAPSIMDAVSKDAQGNLSINKNALPQQVQDLLNTGPLKNLTAAQQARVLNYEALGIKNYTVGDVTRNFADTSAEQKLAANTVNPELGAPLRQATMAKNDQLLQAANAAPQVMGAEPVSPDALDAALRSHLKGQLGQANQAIQSAYTQADAVAGNAPQVAMTPVVQALQGNRSQFLASSDGKSLMNGIRARLQDFQGGPPTAPSPPLVRDANGDTLLAQADVPAATTFADSERFRQYLNDVWSPDNASLITPIKNAVDQAQDAAGAGQVYQQARSLRQMRSATFENQSGIANLLATKPGGDPRLPVGQFMDKYVFSDANPDQFKQVVNQLNQGGPQGQQLLSQLRASTMQQAVNNSISHIPGENGVGQFSGANFSRQLGKVGDTNMNTLFTPEQQNYLGSLQRGALDLTTVPQVKNLYNPSGTSGQFGLDVLSGKQPSTLLGKAAKTVGNNLDVVGGGLGLLGGPKGALGGAAAGRFASSQIKAAAERAAAKAQVAQGAAAANPLQAMSGINTAAQQAAQKARINQLIGQRLGGNAALMGGAAQPANGP